MKVKNHTFKIRFIHFITILLGSMVIMLIFQLLRNNFELPQFDVWTIVFLSLMAFLSASNLNKVKLEISDVKAKEELINWIDNYFWSTKAMYF